MFKKQLELRRKLFHIFAGIIIAIIVLSCNKRISIPLIILFILILFLVKSLHKFILFKIIINTLERPKDIKQKKIFKGAIAFCFGSLIALVLFTSKLAAIGIFVLAIGDGLSTLIGYYYGKHKLYKEKTYEGTLAFLIPSFLILIYFTNIFLAIITSIILTLFELISPIKIRKIKINDNLIIPTLTALLILILQPFTIKLFLL